MKKLLLIVASLTMGGLVWAASNSACIFNLIPPTSAVQVCQDGSGQINFQDATAGPVTLNTLNTYGGTASPSFTSVTVTGPSGESVTYGVTAGSVTTPSVTVTTATIGNLSVSTLTVTSSMTVSAASTFSTVTQSSTTLTGFEQLFSKTLATLQAMTPSAVGQLFYCSNCTATPVCVSTGSAAAYQFAGVSVSTAANGLGACK
jgi:hypothetical protein